MKDREIGIGAGRTNGHPGLPEALALEGPVTAGSLSIGQRSTLKPERGDDVIARAQLVLALKGGGLDPEQVVAGNLGNRSHGSSLRATIARPRPLGGQGGGSPSLSAQKAHKWRIAYRRLLGNVITLPFDQRNYWTKLSEYARIG